MKFLVLFVRNCVLFALSSCFVIGYASDSGGSRPTAEEILGNPDYLAMSYSGWRKTSRTDAFCPTVEEIKEDLLIMEAMGVRIIRTYNTRMYAQTERILQAIEELREQTPEFEMYVMVGAWIQCAGFDTSEANHYEGDRAANGPEIERAIELGEEYPEIVKIIAVGNEAMVTWQPHHVSPVIIQKWVNVLREARCAGRLDKDLWITTSDNWAALGGEEHYRNDTLLALLRSLDYVSLHTYAFHDTYYYPSLEWALDEEAELSVIEQSKMAVERAMAHQQRQLAAVRAYMTEHGIDKEIHIGETGWASRDDSYYGDYGTAAADEYKQKLFHDSLRAWTHSKGISCFYFQAFDEPWKSSTIDGSESHFGLFTVYGKAKAVIWHLVDQGVFDGLGRNGRPVTKTFEGQRNRLMETVKEPVILKFKPPVPEGLDSD